MREYVGQCAGCSSEIFCNSGFIQGVIAASGTLYCFECDRKGEEKMSVQYPIGTYEEGSEPTEQQINEWVDELSQLPEQIENAVKKASNFHLETPVREGAWTVKQLVHHIADASMNSYIHFKLALTEDNPTIKPYDEGRWAEMVDENQHELTDTLQLLRAITNRWLKLLQSLTRDQWHKTFVHPTGGQKRLDRYLGFCVWHSKHHTAQIRQFLEAK